MKKTVRAGAVVLCLLIAAFPQIAAEAARGALSLCARVLVPSLFPFMVCSGILLGGGNASGFWGRMAAKVFGLSPRGGAAALLGFLSGYPAGAAVAANLFREGQITRGEAEKLLSFTNNPSPLFALGAVGMEMYQSRAVGYVLWGSALLASFCTGICMRFFWKSKETSGAAPHTQSGGNAVEKAVETVLTLCGFVVLFSVVTAFFEKGGVLILFSSFLQFLGMGENTAGFVSHALLDVSAATAYVGALPTVAALLSLGGVSVFLQTMLLVRKVGLSVKSYFAGKLLSGGLAAFFCSLFLTVFPGAAPVLAPAVSSFSSVQYFPSTLFLTAILWVFLRHGRKNPA